MSRMRRLAVLSVFVAVVLLSQTPHVRAADTNLSQTILPDICLLDASGNTVHPVTPDICQQEPADSAISPGRVPAGSPAIAPAVPAAGSQNVPSLLRLPPRLPVPIAGPRSGVHAGGNTSAPVGLAAGALALSLLVVLFFRLKPRFWK